MDYILLVYTHKTMILAFGVDGKIENLVGSIGIWKEILEFEDELS